MEIFLKQVISQDYTILDAINAIDKASDYAFTLFVENQSHQIVGTLTDGDIRRAFIKGAQLTTLVSEIMHTHFSYLSISEKDHTSTINKLRQKHIGLVPLLDENFRLVKIYNLKNLRSLLPIDAVLMAGGKGERLRPLTEKTPKPLLPVGDKAIIDHNIDRLISYGIDHISVTVNYLKEQLQWHFSEPRSGVKVNCVSEPRFLGTIGSIKFVEKFHNDTVLVMNSDLFTNINYEDFYLHFIEHKADMSVAAVPYSIAVPYGIMDLNGRNIKGMIEKPTYNYYANGGIYLIKRAMLDLIPEGEFFNATDLIDKLIETGHKVIRFPINGTWIDIGNPQEYQKAKDLVKHLR